MADTEKTKNKNKKKTSIQAKPEESSSESSEPPDDDDDDQIGRGVAAGPVILNREEYLQAHRDLTLERSQLQLKNNILHRRLAEYYKKRKLDHVLKPFENSQDLEDKYQQKLFSYEELKDKSEIETHDIETKVKAVQLQYEGRLEHAVKKFEQLEDHERSTGSGLIYSKKGKPISDKVVASFLLIQQHKSEQSSALQLRYIRARNAVAELDAIVRKLESLGPGLYVAHFEQLFIDNQNYRNKIEEREDELIRNRTKCTEHSQILAHIREKMNHNNEVIDSTECDLGDAEIDYLRAREDLGTVKSHRDHLRWDLEGERLKAGLLTRKELLRDYQDATDEVIPLREKKKQLEEQIIETTKKLRDARKLIQNGLAAETDPDIYDI